MNTIQDPKTALAFLLAGNAHVTIVSHVTGTRFTYRVRKPVANGGPGALVHFVAVLTRPDYYEYLGSIHGARLYAHGKRSTISSEAPSAKAFAWIFRALTSRHMPTNIDFYHEGRCGKCGRQLTTPRSIELGLGPECARSAAGGL